MSEVSHVKSVLGVREIVIEKCWSYLNDNFHKLTEANKIKVAIAISTKNIPQKVEGMDQKQIVIMGEIKREDGAPKRYNIGSDLSPENLTAPPETVSDN